MIPDTLQQASDSITMANLQRQVDSLSQEIDAIGIGTGYFESIISQQQSLFGILVGVFTLIVVIALGVSYISTFGRIERQLKDLKAQTEEASSIMTDIPEMKQQLLDVNMDARRALWENEHPTSFMRIVWHIRYCDSFIKRNHDGYLEDVYFHFIGAKSKSVLAEEYEYIKEEEKDQFQHFVNFKNIGGIKETLNTILKLATEDKYIPMRELALKILRDIKENRNVTVSTASTATGMPSDLEG